MRGPCAKQRVIATIVTTDGDCFVGENDCAAAQEICPRAGMATGEGYQICKDICQQTGHAEINALRRAGVRAKGGMIFIEGHTYACTACRRACDEVGIEQIIIVPSRATLPKVAGYLHRLKGTPDWNISLPSQMHGAFAYQKAWPEKIEIVPLFVGGCLNTERAAS